MEGAAATKRLHDFVKAEGGATWKLLFDVGWPAEAIWTRRSARARDLHFAPWQRRGLFGGRGKTQGARLREQLMLQRAVRVGIGSSAAGRADLSPL